jgi:hypothetical protein
VNIQHDLWHKGKKMAKDWNKIMRKRYDKYGSFLFPTLKEKITAEDLNRVFSYCSEHCKGDKQSSSNFGNHTWILEANTIDKRKY